MFASCSVGQNRENILVSGLDVVLFAFDFCLPRVKETHMTQGQRLKYSILLSLLVLATMLGLSYLQKDGVISEKVFQYIAIGVAVVVVIVNGIMRRKVKL